MISISSRAPNRSLLGLSALGLGTLLLLSGCGGGNGGGGTTPPPTTYTLTVNSTNPASGVAMTSITPAPLSGSPTGNSPLSLTYDAGASVTLTAPATAGGNNFGSWSGCTSTSGASGDICSITINSNTTVTANYTTPTATVYTLTVASANPSSGVTITSNTPDTNKVSSGSSLFTLDYDSGTSVVLTAPATASNGNTFGSWTGCTSTTGDTCTVAVNANTTVTANYTTPVTPTYTLTVATTNPASGVAMTSITPAPLSGSPTGTSPLPLTYDAGTSVTLTAPAIAGGNAFGSWTGCTSTSGDTCTVAVNANTTVTANYTTPVTPTYTLTVATTNPASGVAMTDSPADNNKLTSGTSQFTLNYNSGTPVTVTAPLAAPNGNTFGSWTGCTSTTGASGNSCNLTVSANATITANYVTPYTVTVHTSNPSSGVTITATTDATGLSSGTSPVTFHYAPGTNATITAPATTGGNNFSSWTGCTSASGEICSLTVNSATTITATYVTPTPTIAISPASGSSVTVGQSQQFTATVQNESNTAVTWSVAVASGTGSAGTISSTGLYQTPYPAPTSVTVTATSVADSSLKESVTINLSAPATAAGPALTVDADITNPAVRPISPLIYGMNAYLLDSGTAQSANITIARWGGDDTSRYNYQTGTTNSASDYYFENSGGVYGMLGTASGTNNPTNFNDFIAETNSLGIKSIGTANVLGYVTNTSTSACSFPKATYPGQQLYNGNNCGNGIESNGTTDLFGNPAATPPTWQTTSLQEAPPTLPGAGGATTSWALSTWTGGWVNCLVTTASNCTNAAGKDATIWDLDNEPAWWDAVHRDVHPAPSTYDEVTQGGIGTALAIKTEDPNALVSGPVIDYWWNYFYSKQDVENGWAHGSPCYQPWSDPTDRTAHGDVPMIVYYLQQMAAASNTYGMRLLDFVDIHSYSAATYNGSSVGLTTAGDTGEQQARMNSTRALWDPTYTDPNFPQPNYTTDANYTSSCTTPLQAPQIIPMMQSWITAGWINTTYSAPGTSIDEYNFGGLESINGAVTQADILGIFGKYGLDMATLWPSAVYTSEGPGNMAFEIYRNYDGSKSTFGDSELSSNTGDQSKLAIYAGVRGANATPDDGAVTIVVINKTYGPLTSTLSVDNLTGSPASAQVYQYSNANLTAIVAQPDATITPPASGGTTSTLSATFPAQSITLIVIPQ